MSPPLGTNPPRNQTTSCYTEAWESRSPEPFLYLGKIKANLGEEFPELLCHFLQSSPITCVYQWLCVGQPAPDIPAAPSSAHVGDKQTCVPMPEGMCRSIQSELLQDGFNCSLDEVVGVQTTTLCAKEKWLVGIPSSTENRRHSASCGERAKNSFLPFFGRFSSARLTRGIPEASFHRCSMKSEGNHFGNVTPQIPKTGKAITPVTAVRVTFSTGNTSTRDASIDGL